MTANGNPQCLIVDDDEGICELIRDSLAAEHINALAVHNGADALKALDSRGPLLTLLDLRLPDRDGRDIADALRERTPRVPFIVISGVSDAQVAIDLMKKGAVDFLIKDLAFLKLVPGVVKRALAEQERERKLSAAESALRESEERFRQIAENIRDVFYITTVEGRVLYASPAYEQIWGRKLDALYHDPAQRISAVLPEDREQITQSLALLRTDEAHATMLYRVRRPDGGIRWIEDRVFGVRDEHGKVYRLAGLATDVTERRTLEQEILNISESERRRIGHDLHDDLCQRLAATKLKCELLARQIEKEAPEMSDLATDISKKIAESTVLCRGIARGLSPVDVEGDGLMAALAKLVEQSEAIYEVPCFFHCPLPVRISNNTVAAHLYRIAQELINNAARHAQPNQIDMSLTSDGENVRLEVANDGQAFREPTSTPGMGLKIIRYRAGAINATVQFHPRGPGLGGTTAACLVPLTTCQTKEKAQP